MEAPKALAHEAIYDTVERILKDAPRGKLLDVPAGEGALSLKLKNMGFDVHCCDLYPELFKLSAIDIKPGDLDKTLPYDDHSFDQIVCVEGLEHIENPANAIREFARLLKPNGKLIVSVPNIMNIEERLKWLFNGYTSHFKPVSRESLQELPAEYSEMQQVALHVNPIGYSEVRYLLEKNGFELQSAHIDKPKKNIWLYFPLTALIRLGTKFISAGKRKARWANELSSNEVLLGGNTLIFEAQKI